MTYNLIAHPTPNWIVWRRVQGEKWKRVAETVTEKDGWDVFYNRCRHDGPGAFDWCVLKDGRKPPK